MAYQPIRWDNVPGSSLSEASRPLDAAARAFDMGFGALHNTLDQRASIDDQNFKAARTNATNALMNHLTGITDVNEFNAAKQALGAQLDSYGAGIDQQAIRNFADQRTSVLQDRALKNIDYTNKTLDAAQAKDRDRIQGMLNSGDKAQIDAAMKELPGMDLRVKADLYRTGNDAQRQLIDRAHADESHKWDGQKVAADILHMGNQDKIGFGQLKVSERNADVNAANAMMTLDKYLGDNDAKLRQEYANTFRNEAGSLAGQAVIDDAISSIKDPDDQKQARIAAAEILKKNPKISTNAVVSSIKGIDANWAIDMLERASAARNATNMDASGAGANDAEYAKNLRATLAAKIATNQSRRDSVAAGGFGLGDRGTGASTNRSAPSDVTVMANPADASSQMDRDPAVQAIQAASRKIGADAAAGKYGPNGYIDGSSATPSPTAQSTQTAAPLPPAAQRLADLTDQLRTGPDGKRPTSADMFNARAAANAEAQQIAVQQEAAKKAAAKVAQQALVDAANKRNAEFWAKQSALNDQAAAAEKQHQADAAAKALSNKIAKEEANLASAQKLNDAWETNRAKTELKRLRLIQAQSKSS